MQIMQKNCLCNSSSQSSYLHAMKTFFNASEVARLLGCNPSTVKRWLDKGLIKGAFQPSGGKQWRIPREYLDKQLGRGNQP